MRRATFILAGLVTAAGTIEAAAQQGACFYFQPNYQGQPMCIAPMQRLPTLSPSVRGRIASAQIPNGLRVTVCDNDNLTGSCLALTQPVPDFSALGAPGRVASIASESGGGARGGPPQAGPQPGGNAPPRPPAPPQQQGGYQPSPPQQGGYQPPQQSGGYQSPPQQQGGYQPQPAPSQQGGYQSAPQQQGGYQPQPPQQGGYQSPPRQQGGYQPAPQQGGYQPPQQQGGYQPPSSAPYQQGGNQQGAPMGGAGAGDQDREKRRALRRECRRGDNNACTELGRLLSQPKSREN